MENKNYVSILKLAEKTGYWYTSIIRWVREGKLNAIKINGEKCIDEEEFNRFLVENRIKKPHHKKSKQNTKELPIEQCCTKSKIQSDSEEIKKVATKLLELTVNSHFLTPKQYIDLEAAIKSIL